MADSMIDYGKLYRDGLPDPAAKWAPFPPYYFVGGNNDPEQIPVEGLIEAATSVLRREGSKLAIYFQWHDQVHACQHLLTNHSGMIQVPYTEVQFIVNSQMRNFAFLEQVDHRHLDHVCRRTLDHCVHCLVDKVTL